MAIKTTSEHSMMAEINVTPLVDVMLVLLVIFIVTAPLLMHAVPVKLPQTASTSAVDPSKSVQLSIDQTGAVFIDTRPVELEQLKAELLSLKRQNPELSVQLLGDERVPYGRIAKVMAVANQAGAAKLSLVMTSGG
jgi:biopolymer transport protein TolR